jgi:hypothetical protein
MKGSRQDTASWFAEGTATKVLPFPDQQILRAINAADELRAEVKRLNKVIKRIDAILESKQLTSTQRDVLDDLIFTVDVWRKVQEGNWEVPDHLQKRARK